MADGRWRKAENICRFDKAAVFSDGNEGTQGL